MGPHVAPTTNTLPRADYYNILGVSKDADDAELKKGWGPCLACLRGVGAALPVRGRT
jgi:hypothetical protein